MGGERMKLRLCRGMGATLQPADEATAEAIRSMTPGEVHDAEVKKHRNPRFHKKAMALIQLVYNNQELYTNFDKFRRALTIEAGYFDDLMLLDGTTIREAKSISFAKMDELEFGKFYNALLDTITTVVLPGANRAELNQQVEQFQWS